MGKQFSDQDLDNLISTVQSSINKAEALAKSQPNLKKAFGKDDDKDKGDPSQPSAAAAPAGDDAGADPAEAGGAPAGAPAAPAGPADADNGNAEAAPGDAAAGGQPGADGQPADQQLQQDAGAQAGQEQPLSDEELNQIYGSMPPDELERHYMVIRQHLQDAYAKAEAGEGVGMEPEGPRATNPHPTPGSAGSDTMDKSEVDAKFLALEKKFEDQMTKVVAALEIGFTPSRKSIANEFQIVSKNEGDNRVQPLTKDEKIAKLKQIGPAALSKAERDDMNAYILRGECEGEMDKIISRGGK